MTDKHSLAKDISNLQKVGERQEDIEKKLDELLALLADTNLDSESVKSIQERVSVALELGAREKKEIEEFQKIDELAESSSREELLDEFSVLLLNNRVDSRLSSSYIRKERLSAFVLFITGTIMVGLGFAMIVMPAPPYFEMFTIYHFTTDDGVTLMDLIALCIVFSGVYLMIRSFYKQVSNRKKK